MHGLSDDEPAARVPSTRRERRIARSRASRTAALAGWLGYGVGVFVVVTAAAWLAVRGGTPVAPGPVAKKAVVQPVIALPVTTTTVTGGTTAPAAPVVTPGIPATTTTTTTTSPVLAAAVTPAPLDTTP